MITGKVATGMYWGGIIVIVFCLVGTMILSGMGKDAPPEILMALTTALGFVFGTYVVPNKKLTDVPVERELESEKESGAKVEQ